MQGSRGRRSAEIIKAGQTATVSEDVQVRPGGNRWNGVEEEYPELTPEFGEHPIVKNAATLYQGRCKVERLQSHLCLDEDQSRGIEQRRDIVAGTGRAG